MSFDLLKTDTSIDTISVEPHTEKNTQSNEIEIETNIEKIVNNNKSKEEAVLQVITQIDDNSDIETSDINFTVGDTLTDMSMSVTYDEMYPKTPTQYVPIDIETDGLQSSDEVRIAGFEKSGTLHTLVNPKHDIQKLDGFSEKVNQHPHVNNLTVDVSICDTEKELLSELRIRLLKELGDTDVLTGFNMKTRHGGFDYAHLATRAEMNNMEHPLRGFGYVDSKYYIVDREIIRTQDTEFTVNSLSSRGYANKSEFKDLISRILDEPVRKIYNRYDNVEIDGIDKIDEIDKPEQLHDRISEIQTPLSDEEAILIAACQELDIIRDTKKGTIKGAKFIEPAFELPCVRQEIRKWMSKHDKDTPSQTYSTLDGIYALFNDHEHGIDPLKGDSALVPQQIEEQHYVDACLHWADDILKTRYLAEHIIRRQCPSDDFYIDVL